MSSKAPSRKYVLPDGTPFYGDYPPPEAVLYIRNCAGQFVTEASLRQADEREEARRQELAEERREITDQLEQDVENARQDLVAAQELEAQAQADLKRMIDENNLLRARTDTVQDGIGIGSWFTPGGWLFKLGGFALGLGNAATRPDAAGVGDGAALGVVELGAEALGRDRVAGGLGLVSRVGDVSELFSDPELLGRVTSNPFELTELRNRIATYDRSIGEFWGASRKDLVDAIDRSREATFDVWRKEAALQDAEAALKEEQEKQKEMLGASSETCRVK